MSQYSAEFAQLDAELRLARRLMRMGIDLFGGQQPTDPAIRRERWVRSLCLDEYSGPETPKQMDKFHEEGTQ